ncbi:hypothetical protein PR202_gb13470 [Eleusine coracana subsp. coracana]|uniref:Secreted protein n=1 Tax=Eleusine coracana subsp. coracana TaxID=191504 RepID=A0AAV5ES51_ELECO|nr:hypothetical protein PR202_gb13470 [Eleusine coracana subsp. coracana]
MAAPRPPVSLFLLLLSRVALLVLAACCGGRSGRSSRRGWPASRAPSTSGLLFFLFLRSVRASGKRAFAIAAAGI